MKQHYLITTSLILLCPLSCTHITMLGHKTGYDVNAEFSGDPVAPASLNAGFEGRTFAAVPPRKALPWNLNFLVDKLPEKDVMSSLLELKITKVNSSKSRDDIAFDYITSGATGLAADAAAGAEPDGTSPSLIKNPTPSTETKNQAEKISKKIEEITDSKTIFN